MKSFFLILGILLFSRLSSADQNLTILYTGFSLGEILPCGCTEEGDLGGILRRATIIEKERSVNKNILILDAGDSFKEPTEQGKLKAKTFIEAMNKMGYDAILPGEKDFIYGEDIINKGSFNRWLLSNVENQNIEKSKTVKYVLKKLEDGTTIAIIGLLGPEVLHTEGQTKVIIQNPLDALKKLLEKLKAEGNANIVLLLTHMKKERAKELFNHKDVDIVINGHLEDDELIVEPEIVGNRIMAHARERGQFLGKITLSISNNRIQKVVNEYIALPKNVNDSQSVQALYDKYNEDTKQFFLKWLEIAKREKSKKSSFVTAEVCKMCHRADYDIWKKSGHSHAFKTLEKPGKTFDPECLICHTTGFRQEGGFLAGSITPKLKDVQCEGCHEAGLEHIKLVGQNKLSLMERTKYYRKATKDGCLKCHTRENSPKYNFETYWKKIKHFGKNVEGTRSQRLMGRDGYLMDPAFNNRWKK